ncbi:MAG: TIGR03009 domain-containing protein [Planctomycetota bacterium]
MSSFRQTVGTLTGLLLASSIPLLHAQVPAGNQINQAVPAGANQVANQAAATPQLPFPALTPQQQQEIDQHLLQWQARSQGTKTLETKYVRWHFDQQKAAAGVPAHRAEGQIKYSSPDKGLFRDDSIVFYTGMKEQKPQFAGDKNRPGDYWVCNGREVVQYDRGKQKCTVLTLPAEMQGTQIFNSPLPFVFNLDAAQIKQRFWVRSLPSPKPNTILIEAWPRKQNDRAQYKLVQVALNPNYDIEALIIYAPNFNVRTAQNYDQYEFSKPKRNSITAGLRQNWLGNFIPQQPPKGWEVVRENFAGPPQVAGQPPAQQPIR